MGIQSSQLRIELTRDTRPDMVLMGMKVDHGLILKMTRTAYSKMSDIALNNNGTIFGGYVRDQYISEYYNQVYSKKYGEYLNTEEGQKNEHKADRYWDKNFLPSTKARLLIPDDMDVCFYKQEEADNFIDDLKNMREFRNVTVDDVTQHSYYYSPSIASVTQVRADMYVGAIPFICDGIKISIYADVVVPKPNVCMQPPFNNLDMLCNGFILTKTGKKFSKSTGTVIDSFLDYERTQAEAEILKNLVKFKTHLCFTTTYRPSKLNKIALKRIDKMQKKNLNWTFLNMPFKTETYTPKEEKEDCFVCTSEFKDKAKIAFTSLMNAEGQEVNASKMHHRCLMKWLRYQNKKPLTYHGCKFVFMCPCRNPIDFSKCIKDIEKAYDMCT